MNRIASLPLRDWTANGDLLAEQLTAALRTDCGTMRLRPVQAVSLAEAMSCQGLFGHIRVGAGKTLVTALLPRVLHAVRPMLLVPASLVDKTIREFDVLRLHWTIPQSNRITSYSRLGLSQHNDLLDAYAPDLIIADEAHKLRRVRDSAVARRVARYMAAHPGTRFAALSGTLSRGSLRDYAHLLEWSLRDGAPIPRDEDALSEWCDLLDADADPDGPDPFLPLRVSLGSSCTDIESSRRAFSLRLQRTPGVIITLDAFTDVPLTLRAIPAEVPDALSEAFATLRNEWTAPDGWLLGDAAFEVWRVARQLALGFYYRHDPRPPEDWWQARKAWCKFVRNTIQDSDFFDSEFQVASACESGSIQCDEWHAWKAIRDTFHPNTVAEWLSLHAVMAAAEWGIANSPALIWTEHVAFAEMLSTVTGWKYYGEEGLAPDGEYIENADPKRNAIVSIQANGTGRNLQAWHRGYLVAPMNSGVTWEQFLGRMHRDGQKHAVEVDTPLYVIENAIALDKARKDAEYIRDTTGQPQKILDADWH